MQQAPVTIGAGLKMYLGHQQTLEWIAGVAAVAKQHPALESGDVHLFVLPTFPALVHAVQVLAPLGVGVGAQDLFWEDRGPYTGEVSGAELAEIGCSLVEVGHVERRTHFGETDEVVAAKTAAALRNGLTPVICVGESQPGEPAAAASESVRQLAAALAHSERAHLLRPVIVAYEPHWAIGAESAAGPDHIATVCARLKALTNDTPGLAGSRVIYGGSAGPGLLAELRGTADGLFLGRSSHDPAALESVLHEAASLARARRAGYVAKDPDLNDVGSHP